MQEQTTTSVIDELKPRFHNLRIPNGAQAVRIISWAIFRGVMQDIDTVASHGFPGTSVFHFVAQIAVTTSLANPRHGFGFNALGTPNLRRCARPTNHCRSWLLQPTGHTGALRHCA